MSGSGGRGPSSCWGATTVLSFPGDPPNPAASPRPRYDDPVTAPSSRAAIRSAVRILGTAAGIVLLLAACSPTTTTTARPSASGPSATASPALTAVPGNPSGSPKPTIAPPGTTTTDFGTIFDRLPPTFPKLPGQEPADDTTGGPTSGSFVANTTVAAAVAGIRAALTTAGWTVDVGSPLEDGSVVLEATGARAGCRTEVHFTPLSGTVIMSVLYGASCPFG